MWSGLDLDQVWTVTPLSTDQGEGPSANGEAVQGRTLNPLQLWQELHWWGQVNAEDQVEGAPRGLPERGLEKSAVAEHAWKDHHAIKWEEPTVVDMARQPSQLLLKEAIHMTPAEEHLNRDTGLELPGCWVAALRRQEGKTNQTSLTPTGGSCMNSGDTR